MNTGDMSPREICDFFRKGAEEFGPLLPAAYIAVPLLLCFGAYFLVTGLFSCGWWCGAWELFGAIVGELVAPLVAMFAAVIFLAPKNISDDEMKTAAFPAQLSAFIFASVALFTVQLLMPLTLLYNDPRVSYGEAPIVAFRATRHPARQGGAPACPFGKKTGPFIGALWNTTMGKVHRLEDEALLTSHR
eukprot:gene1846-542_t